MTLFSPRRSASFQSAAVAAGAAVAQAAVAVLLLLAARQSSPSEFGNLVAGIAIGTTIAAVVDFGTNTYWSRELARGALDLRSVNERATAKVAFGALACTFASLALWSLWHSQLWIAGPVGLTLLVAQAAQVPARGIGRGEIVARSTVVDRLAALFVFLALPSLGVGIFASTWVALCVGCLVGAIICALGTPPGTRPSVALARLRSPWRGSGSFGVYAVAGGLQTLDLPLLGIVGGSAAAGTYGAVSRWTQPMGLLASSFAAVSAPYFARSGNLREAWKWLGRARWIPVLAALLATFVVVGAPVLVHVLLGPSYASSIPALRLLGCAALLSVVNSPLQVALQSVGRERLVATFMVLATSLQLVTVLVLGSTFGASAAAVASIVAQALLFVGLAASAWRLVANRPRVRLGLGLSRTAESR